MDCVGLVLMAIAGVILLAVLVLMAIAGVILLAVLTWVIAVVIAPIRRRIRRRKEPPDPSYADGWMQGLQLWWEQERQRRERVENDQSPPCPPTS